MDMIAKAILMLPMLAAVSLTASAQTAATAQDSAQTTTTAADTLSLEAYYHNLPEVVVKAEKPIVKLEQGKMTFNMPNLLEKIPADNAFDAITHIPGVAAIDDNLTFGGSTITLIVNGKATTLTQEQAKERLRNMPAAQLQQAELMLSAPAKYHVRGAAINIVTKDYAGQHHTSGQLQGTYNQSKRARGYGKGNLLHAAGNLTLDLSYAYANGENYGEVEHSALHPLGEKRVAYEDMTKAASKGYTHDMRAELDYRFAEGHDISLAYTGKIDKNNSHNWSTGNSIADQFGQGHNYLHNLDLNYSLPFGLQLTAAYTYYKSPQDQWLDGRLFDDDRNLTAESRQTINKWLLAADQEHELRNGWGLNYGVMWQASNNNSFQTTVNADGQQLPEATSSVDIDERIVNAYIGFSKQIGKAISIDASLAVENYHTPTWNDWHLYPSLNATWMVSEQHMLNLAFNSDAAYPSYWSTMNQVFYSSPYSEIWGNPQLRPSHYYNTSLTWQIHRKYTLVAFANINPDGFVQLPYQPSDRMAVIMKMVNFNHRNSYGMQAMAQYSLGQWLSGNAFVVGMVSHDKCDDFFDIAFNRKKFTFVAGGNATAVLSRRHRLRLILNPLYQSKAIQGVYDIKGMFKLDASLRWASADGAWSVMASLNNATNRKMVTSSTMANQNYHMKVRQDWRTAALTVIYKFGNYKEKRHRQVDTSRLRQ